MTITIIKVRSDEQNMSFGQSICAYRVGLELQSSVGLGFLWEDVVIENTLEFWHTPFFASSLPSSILLWQNKQN